MSDNGPVEGPDGKVRCPWGLSAPEYLAYHDEEWGRPLHGDTAIFERLCLEGFQSPEELEPLIPGMHDPAESPEPLTAEPPAAAAATQAPGLPRTTLILKASGPRPEPHEATQPSQVLQDPEKAHDATEPTAVPRDGEEPGEATQPSATLVPDDTLGPQGSFDTHGWWAQQKEAAREERAQAHAAGEEDDDSMAAAEEQGW